MQSNLPKKGFFNFQVDHKKKSWHKFDGFVKSPTASHCEERSDEAIP
jgi:hypothetical protein